MTKVKPALKWRAPERQSGAYGDDSGDAHPLERPDRPQVHKPRRCLRADRWHHRTRAPSAAGGHSPPRRARAPRPHRCARPIGSCARRARPGQPRAGRPGAKAFLGPMRLPWVRGALLRLRTFSAGPGTGAVDDAMRAIAARHAALLQARARGLPEAEARRASEVIGRLEPIVAAWAAESEVQEARHSLQPLLEDPDPEMVRLPRGAYCRPYRLNVPKAALAREELDELDGAVGGSLEPRLPPGLWPMGRGGGSGAAGGAAGGAGAARARGRWQCGGGGAGGHGREGGRTVCGRAARDVRGVRPSDGVAGGCGAAGCGAGRARWRVLTAGSGS